MGSVQSNADFLCVCMCVEVFRSRTRESSVLGNGHQCNKQIIEVYKLGLSLGCFGLLVCRGGSDCEITQMRGRMFLSVHSLSNLINASVASPVWARCGEAGVVAGWCAV